MADLRGTFGANVARLRRARNLTQEQLAHEMETDHAYISRLEAGKKNASIDTIAKLAAALDVEPAEFLKLAPKAKQRKS